GIRDDLVTGVQTCALPIYAVAEAAHGLDRVAADLGAQVVDVHFEGVAADLLVPAVEARLQLAARQDTPRPLDQRLQQREFAARRSEERRVGKGGGTQRAGG